MTPSKIHPTAIIDPKSKIDSDVEVGAYAIIEGPVSIGAGSKVGPHAVISGRTSIGKNNLISAFASLGSRPQDLKFKGEDTVLEIGDDNMFREYCNVSLGTAGGGGKTVIGSRNLFMVYTHVAHDCVIGSNVIVANGVAIAGHVEVGDGAVIGGLAAIHQFCRIGKLSMTAGGAMVTQDVIPYGMVHGDRASINGLNVVGLRRLGAKAEDLKSIKQMYHLVFESSLTVEDATKKILEEVPDSQFRVDWIQFIQKSERGLCR